MKISQNKKQKAFLEAYQPYHDSLVRFCASRAYGLVEVDDLVQEVLVAAFTNFHKIEDMDRIQSYLFSTAVNILRSKNRRLKFRGKYEDRAAEMLIDRGADPDVAYDVEVLYKMLNKLPEKQRNAVIMFEINGFNMREIADILDSKEGAVKTLISRGRQKLKAMAMEEDERTQAILHNMSAVLAALWI